MIVPGPMLTQLPSLRREKEDTSWKDYVPGPMEATSHLSLHSQQPCKVRNTRQNLQKRKLKPNNDLSKVTQWGRSSGTQNVQEHRLSLLGRAPHPHFPTTLISEGATPAEQCDRLNCVPTKFICSSPNPSSLRM